MLAVVGLSGAIDITGGEAFIAHDHDHGHEYEEKHEEEKHAEEKHEEGFNLGFMTLTGWAAFLTVVTSGILLESVLTALIVGFLVKVRPDMLGPVHKAAG